MVAYFSIRQGHVRFFNPAEWVETPTLTVESVRHRMAYVIDAVFKSLFPCFQKHSHASFLMFRILLDKGVDSIRWRGTGMVWYYIESRSSVFVF